MASAVKRNDVRRRIDRPLTVKLWGRTEAALSHTGAHATTYRMDATVKRRHDRRRMPLDLTDAELATAATACRAMAHQESKRAREMENPTMRAPLENNAKRFAALAEKLEAARKIPR